MGHSSPLIQIRRRPPSPLERCDFCGADIPVEHGHLVDVSRGGLLCVCRACYLLFPYGRDGGARFRAVPERYVVLPAFADRHGDWDMLDVPVGLAFFFRRGATGSMSAMYPSPAGAIESDLRFDVWDEIVAGVPPLATLVPDVEALLVRRPPTGPARPQRAIAMMAAIVPIDVCYELIGRIRRAWRGLDGGDAVWRDIDELFGLVADRARMGAA